LDLEEEVEVEGNVEGGESFPSEDDSVGEAGVEPSLSDSSVGGELSTLDREVSQSKSRSSFSASGVIDFMVIVCLGYVKSKRVVGIFVCRLPNL